MKCKFILGNPVHFVNWCLWLEWFLSSSFMYLKKRTANIMLIMTHKAVVCVPGYVMLRFWVFSWIAYSNYTRLRAYLLSALLSQMWSGILWIRKLLSRLQKKTFLNLLSFNLLKVCCGFFFILLYHITDILYIKIWAMRCHHCI